MELPREVMDDLMVMYLGGEASPATARLVEEYAAAHSDYAELLRRAQQPPPLPAAAPDKEMEVIKMTRKHLFLRSLFVGGGIFFTLAPFTSLYKDGSFAFLLFRDAPGAASGLWSVAVASWVAAYLMHRAVRRAGL
jgi:hypothetical protein